MISNYYIKDDFSQLKSVSDDLNLSIVDYFYKSIHYNLDQIIGFVFSVDKNQKTYYQIYQKVFRIMSWYWYELQAPIKLKINCFQGQKYITVFNISFQVLLETWQIVFSANQLFAVIDSMLIYKRVVVVLANSLGANNL